MFLNVPFKRVWLVKRRECKRHIRFFLSTSLLGIVFVLLVSDDIAAGKSFIIWLTWQSMVTILMIMDKSFRDIVKRLQGKII